MSSKLIDTRVSDIEAARAKHQASYCQLLRRDATDATSNADGKRLQDLMGHLDLSPDAVSRDRGIIARIIELEQSIPSQKTLDEADARAEKRGGEIQKELTRLQDEYIPALNNEFGDIFGVCTNLIMRRDAAHTQIAQLKKEHPHLSG